MWHKSDDYRRHQEQRVIARRLRIVANIWDSPYGPHEGYPKPHRLAKFNLVCSCVMCSWPKYNRQETGRQVKETQERAWGIAV